MTIDRAAAASFTETKRCDFQGNRTNFGQLFQQIKGINPEKLRNNRQPFTVAFKGEYGDDAGGLFRELMSMISHDIESVSLPLFIISPNGHNNLGKNCDVFVPKPDSTTAECIEMYEFLGKLIGVAIRTGNPLTINLADLFWKRLVGKEITIEDITSIDTQFSNVCQIPLDNH